MRARFGFIIISFVMALAACSDGVPAVDDPHHPVDVQGNPIKGTEFVQKYCLDKPTNETCARVHQAVSIDSARGGLPKGW